MSASPTAFRASVIVPAYNEAATIGDLLDALQHVDPSIEICVACNGCRDATEEICNAYAPRVRVLAQSRPSKVEALNRALHETAGAIKLIVDADVMIAARDIERLVELAGQPGGEVGQA
jgi:cellulose synthase/poly-beta-1,6-N-acetylglucosamine synthase-like glycosyltransferase